MKGEVMSFLERANKALFVYGAILPADIRQLLKDMAAAIDQLQEKSQ
ncbi:hypothetical protein [Cupriavidus pauculus]